LIPKAFPDARSLCGLRKIKLRAGKRRARPSDGRHAKRRAEAAAEQHAISRRRRRHSCIQKLGAACVGSPARADQRPLKSGAYAPVRSHSGARELSAALHLP